MDKSENINRKLKQFKINEMIDTIEETIKRLKTTSPTGYISYEYEPDKLNKADRIIRDTCNKIYYYANLIDDFPIGYLDEIIGELLQHIKTFFNLKSTQDERVKNYDWAVITVRKLRHPLCLGERFTDSL